jgi:glycosyltransferase involved in cell wall biosynthesis
MPLISVCIPCYQRVDSLRRLYESIALQSFRDFEAIVSDDSADNRVHDLTEEYKDKFAITYIKNPTPLGTPANWNQAIRHSKGQWIKLMHDDDWFSSPESLKIFSEHTGLGNKFIFSGYTRVFAHEKKQSQVMVASSSVYESIAKEPNLLFVNNWIGPPSVTLIHRSIGQMYDENLKWRVDIDFYIRLLEDGEKFTYINSALINVGMSASQVTKFSINDPKVELPEGWIILKKHGVKSLKNIRVYDAWWRLFRNTNVSTEKQLLTYADENWPNVILRMIKDINKVPSTFLKWGLTSKACMALSYLKNLSTIS